MPVTAEVFGISRHRVNIDGNGITTLVCFMGCHLYCKYCINRVCHYSKEELKKNRIQTKIFTAKELYDVVCIDNLYFSATGGGITFGGGEPGLYDLFIQEFKQICNPNWKINMETSLNFPTSNMRNLLSIIDSFIIDIKDMSSKIYKKYTSMSNNFVINNLQLLKYSTKFKNTQIRVPHICNYNTPSDVYNSVAILRMMGFTNIEEFTYILPDEIKDYE